MIIIIMIIIINFIIFDIDMDDKLGAVGALSDVRCGMTL
jgi:hypothetical protein